MSTSTTKFSKTKVIAIVVPILLLVGGLAGLAAAQMSGGAPGSVRDQHPDAQAVGSPGHKGAPIAAQTIDVRRAALPEPTGAISDVTAAKQIEASLGEYLELQQSVLVPNYNDSPSWPSTTPSEPAGTSSDIPPVEDSQGNFAMTPAQQAAMVNAAYSAAQAVTTPAYMQEMEAWLPGALAREGTSGNAFEVVGAGEYITSFVIDSESATTTTTTSRVTVWENQAYQAADGSVSINTIQSAQIETDTLVLSSSGTWQVSYDNFTFAPGQGP